MDFGWDNTTFFVGLPPMDLGMNIPGQQGLQRVRVRRHPLPESTPAAVPTTAFVEWTYVDGVIIDFVLRLYLQLCSIALSLWASWLWY